MLPVADEDTRTIWSDSYLTLAFDKVFLALVPRFPTPVEGTVVTVSDVLIRVLCFELTATIMLLPSGFSLPYDCLL